MTVSGPATPAIHAGYDKARAVYDVPYFCRYAVPELFIDDIPRFHRACLVLDTDRTKLRVCQVMPRGFAKTTIKKGAVLHAMAMKPKEQRRFEGLISESQPQAIDDLDDVKHIVTDGEAFPKLYPFVEQGPVWGAEEIETSNRMKLVALGTRQRIRGRNYHGQRFDRIWLDDFESENNTESPLERQRIKRWVRAAVIPALRKGSGRIVAKGTIVHEDSYLSMISGRDSKWSRVFLRAKRNEGDPHKGLYDDDGMLWGKPHRDQSGNLVAFDEEWWRSTREEYRAEGLLDQFYQEFQNDALPEDGAFDASTFRYYKSFGEDADGWYVMTADGEKRAVEMYAGVDTSTAEGHRADFCVIMPVGVDESGVVYQFPYVRERFGKDVSRISAAFFALHDLYRFRGVEIDSIGAQVYVAGEIRRQRDLRGTWFNIAENKTKKDKDSKVYSLKPRFEAGLFVLHPERSAELVHELIYYRKAKHDDLADAAYYANSIARPLQKPVAYDGRVVQFPDGRVVPYADATWNWKAA